MSVGSASSVAPQRCGERLADEEIAVAVHEVDRGAARARASRKRLRDRAVERVVEVVVAGPVFEQIAEDVQRVARRARAAQEVEELLDDRAAARRARCRSEMNAVHARALDADEAIAGAATAAVLRLQTSSAFSMIDVVDRHVLVHAARCRSCTFRIWSTTSCAFDHRAEHAVAPALRRRRGVVEERVVGDVDEELRGRRMRVGRARHRDRVVVVLESVVGFVLDRRARSAFCFMPGSKPPPWIMKPSITRWNTVLSKKPLFTYSRKFATVSGARSRVELDA